MHSEVDHRERLVVPEKDGIQLGHLTKAYCYIFHQNGILCFRLYIDCRVSGIVTKEVPDAFTEIIEVMFQLFLEFSSFLFGCFTEYFKLGLYSHGLPPEAVEGTPCGFADLLASGIGLVFECLEPGFEIRNHCFSFRFELF